MINQQKIVAIEQSSNLISALFNAQESMGELIKGKKNEFFKTSYADLNSVLNVIEEPLHDNNLLITQIMEIDENNAQILKTRLMHKNGEFLDSKMILPKESNPQKLGSLITYLRRYSLMSLLKLSAVDDDGNLCSDGDRKITSKQVSQLEELINGHSELRKKVLHTCEGNLKNLTKNRFDGAIKWIRKEVEKIDCISKEVKKNDCIREEVKKIDCITINESKKELAKDSLITRYDLDKSEHFHDFISAITEATGISKEDLLLDASKNEESFLKSFEDYKKTRK